MNRLKNSNSWAADLLNFLTLSVMLFYLIFLWKTYPFFIGGTMIFSGVIGINFYISFVRKEFSLALSFFSLTLLCIMGFNFFAQMEYIEGVSHTVLIGSMASAFIMLNAIIFLAMFALERIDSNSVPLKIQLWKRVVGLVAPIFMVFTFLLPTAMFFAVLEENGDAFLKKHVINFTVLSSIWILIGIVVILILMAKQKHLMNCIPYIITKKVDFDIASMRKWLFSLSILSLVFGTLFELTRGSWFIWFLSWSIFVLLLIMEWKIWRFVFVGNDCDINEIQIDRVLSIPSFTDPKYLLKFIGFFMLTNILYGLLLFSIWTSFR